jgi:hypothetical protein
VEVGWRNIPISPIDPGFWRTNGAKVVRRPVYDSSFGNGYDLGVNYGVVTGMVSFPTPREAKAYVIGKIVAQAATEGLLLSDFERRLLYDTPSVQEIEEFEDRNGGSDAEDFYAKIVLLTRHGLRRELEKGGSSSREYEQALKLFAADEGDYLAGIVRATVSATISSKVKHGYRKWILLALVCVVGGLALPILLMFLMPTVEKAKGVFEASGLGQKLHRFLDTYGAIALIATLLVVWLFTTIPWARKKWKLRQ